MTHIKYYYQLIRLSDLRQNPGVKILLTDQQGTPITPVLTTDPNRTGRTLQQHFGSTVVEVVEDIPKRLVGIPTKCYIFLATEDQTHLPTDEEGIKKYLSGFNKRSSSIILTKVKTS